MLSLSLCLNAQAQVNVTLDPAKKGAAINPLHYGIFFEEINHAGEGGLYAELIRNRSFEENASEPEFWSAVSGSTISLDTSKPLNGNNPTALKVEMTKDGQGVRNAGFWGMNFEKDHTYHLTFWARGAEGNYNGTITAELRGLNGAVIGSAKVDGITGEWKKFTTDIIATGSHPSGTFALRGSEAGTVCFDVVSLFPPTYKGRENGCRIDLAEKLEALHPAFMRFPGGCYIEGNWTSEHPQSNHFEWKKTIGPIEERPGHYNNNWFYPVTDGLGMMEFLLLCEDLGTEPLYVVNMGMGHGWEDPNVQPYLQDALDAIEFCNGDASTTWGKKRIELGHPEPFNLRLIEIGNENYFFGPYNVRYGQFYQAIHDKYPDMVFIGDGDGVFWNIPHPVDLIDQHYYMTPAWFTGEYHRYDGYNRNTYKIYVGEYAVTGACGHFGNMNAALGEAVFMCGMENNSDVVNMTSYAPIFVNENSIQWAPDIIRFNSGMSYVTPSYYVQQMMAENVGTQNIKWTEENNAYESVNKIGLSTFFTTASYDNLLVTSLEGDTLYFNDFSSTDLSDWGDGGSGVWTVKNGMLCQTNSGMAAELFTLNKEFGNDYIVECDAVKNGGSEGFLLAFNIMSDDDYVWWNVGGWANKKQGIEQTMSGTRGSDANDVKDLAGLQENKKYHLKVRVQGNQATCWLDNAEVNGKTLTRKAQKLYFAANMEDDGRTLYVKVVNPYGSLQRLNLNIKNAVFKSGSVTELGSGSGSNENTTDRPHFIEPKTRSLNNLALTEEQVSQRIKAHSFCIFKLEIETKIPAVEAVPEPLVKYSFEQTDATDESGNYSYSTVGEGSVRQLADNNKVFFSANNGSVNLDKKMAQDVFAKLTGDYAVSIDILPTDITPLNSFSWAYGLTAGTDYYMGMVNSPANKNWYYELRKTPANVSVNADGGLVIGKWHNITYSQANGVGSIYIDGCLLNQSEVTIQPSDFASKITAAYLARSPFGGDVVMSQTYFDDFQIFGSALTGGQVAALYAKASAKATDKDDPTGVKDVLVDKAAAKTKGVYNLQGTKIADNLEQLNGMKGMVIANGKKIMLR